MLERENCHGNIMVLYLKYLEFLQHCFANHDKEWNTVKTLLLAAASNYFDEIFGQFYLAKFESYLVVSAASM